MIDFFRKMAEEDTKDTTEEVSKKEVEALKETAKEKLAKAVNGSKKGNGSAEISNGHDSESNGKNSSKEDEEEEEEELDDDEDSQLSSKSDKSRQKDKDDEIEEVENEDGDTMDTADGEELEGEELEDEEVEDEEGKRQTGVFFCRCLGASNKIVIAYKSTPFLLSECQ